MINKGLFSSNTCEWSTPQYLFDQLDNEFHFDLDPCSSESNYKCAHHFTIEDNGLLQDWSGHIVFCNPPYGRQLKDWVYKAFSSKALTVMLIPSRTDTNYFHDYILDHAEIRFIRGRIKFGNSNNCAPFPSMICIFRNL